MQVPSEFVAEDVIKRCMVTALHVCKSHPFTTPHKDDKNQKHPSAQMDSASDDDDLTLVDGLDNLPPAIGQTILGGKLNAQTTVNPPKFAAVELTFRRLFTALGVVAVERFAARRREDVARERRAAADAAAGGGSVNNAVVPGAAERRRRAAAYRDVFADVVLREVRSSLNVSLHFVVAVANTRRQDSHGRQVPALV
jgi:hypothetical protein